jgi:hypothetical protein
MIFNLFKFSLIILLLTSCKNDAGCKKINLSSDEMSWFTNFVNGDTIFYKNQVDEIDTFLIDAYQTPEYTTCNRFELGPFVYANMGLQFNCIDEYSISNRNKCFYLGFDNIGQDSSDLDCIKELSFFDLKTGTFFDFSKVPKEKYTNSKTGEKMDVFIYTKDYNCSNIDGRTEIMQQFAISKEFGLIWYRTIKGDYYQRVW